MRFGLAAALTLLPWHAFAQTGGLPALMQDIQAEASERAGADARLERAVAAETSRAAAAEAALGTAIAAPAARLQAVDSLGNVLGAVVATTSANPDAPAPTFLQVLRDGLVWTIALVPGPSAVGPAFLYPPSLKADKFASTDCSGDSHVEYYDYRDVGPVVPGNAVFATPTGKYVRILFPAIQVPAYSEKVWDPAVSAYRCTATTAAAKLYRVQEVTMPQEVCYQALAGTQPNIAGCPHLNWPISFEYR